MTPHITPALRAEMAEAALAAYCASPHGRRWPDVVVDAILSRLPSGAWPATATDSMVLAMVRQMQATPFSDGGSYGDFLKRALEAALAAAPKQAAVRTAAGDALAEAVDRFFGDLARAGETAEPYHVELSRRLAAYRAAAPEPWGREQVEELVSIARASAFRFWKLREYDLARAMECAVGPFSTIAEQDGHDTAAATHQPGEAPAAGAPAPDPRLAVVCNTLADALRAMLDHYGPPKSVAELCDYPTKHPITLARNALAAALVGGGEP